MDPYSALALIRECYKINSGLLGLVQLFVQCDVDIQLDDYRVATIANYLDCESFAILAIDLLVNIDSNKHPSSVFVHALT